MSTPPADLRDREFAKILLIKLSAVGDVVHTIPVLNKLRRRFPAAQLDWLVKPAIGEMAPDPIKTFVEFPPSLAKTTELVKLPTATGLNATLTVPVWTPDTLYGEPLMME